MGKKEEKQKGRIIGIRHRVKMTAEGKERPTMVAIKGSSLVCHELKTETDELDFLLGRFPTSYRKPGDDEDISKIKFPRQLRWRTLRKDESHREFPQQLVRQAGGKWHVVSGIPETFGGLQPGDTVVMTFGGSGDRLAFALSRRGEEIGARVLRVPPSDLKRERDKKGADIDDDHKLLIEFFEASPGKFFPVRPRDRSYIAAAEAFRAKERAMKERIACEQRLRKRLIGQIFLSEEGRYPEGEIEDIYDSERANDVILQSLVMEEKRRDREFRQVIRGLEIWEEVLEGHKGLGERHAAGIITAVIDISRFMVEKGESKFTKFCGVHVMEDGSFPRKRRGEVCDWNPMARQSLVLLAEQWNYRPDTEWGQKLRENKRRFRQKHPDVIEVKVKDKSGRMVPKLRYNDAHIHKMAKWRTRNQFARWLYRQWVKIEQRHREEEAAEAAKAGATNTDRLSNRAMFK